MLGIVELIAYGYVAVDCCIVTGAVVDCGNVAGADDATGAGADDATGACGWKKKGNVVCVTRLGGG